MVDETEKKQKPKPAAPGKKPATGKTPMSGKKPAAAKKSAASRSKKTSGSESRPDQPAKIPAVQEPADSSLIKMLTGLPGAMADSAFRFVVKTTDVPLRMGKALFLRPEQADMMKEAGRTIKELREVAGLTRDELSDALDLKDHSLLEAVENGTATLSFDLILRLTAVLARHDPVPVIMKFTRTYKPDLWEVVENWGLGRWTLQFEREREFINIFRRHDAARQLSDEGFAEVLKFTRSAFEMALHFIAEREKIVDQEKGDEELSG
jgi:transcriptional regulator with XRE-family HTH domain